MVEGALSKEWEKEPKKRTSQRNMENPWFPCQESGTHTHTHTDSVSESLLGAQSRGEGSDKNNQRGSASESQIGENSLGFLAISLTLVTYFLFGQKHLHRMKKVF